MSDRTAKAHHIRVGSKLRLLFGGRPKGEPVTVVGMYDSAARAPPTWGLDEPAAGCTAAVSRHRRRRTSTRW